MTRFSIRNVNNNILAVTGILSSNVPSFPALPCDADPNPCANNGTCFNGPINGNGSYFCLCQHPHTGPNCSKSYLYSYLSYLNFCRYNHAAPGFNGSRSYSCLFYLNVFADIITQLQVPTGLDYSPERLCAYACSNDQPA